MVNKLYKIFSLLCCLVKTQHLVAMNNEQRVDTILADRAEDLRSMLVSYNRFMASPIQDTPERQRYLALEKQAMHSLLHFTLAEIVQDDQEKERTYEQFSREYDEAVRLRQLLLRRSRS